MIWPKRREDCRTIHRAPACIALGSACAVVIGSGPNELHDEALARDFKSFDRTSEWPNIAPGDLPAWLPAWYALEHPVAAADVDHGKRSTAAPARAARLVARLIEVERQADWHRLVALREELRSVSEDLFSLYMARRTVRYLR